MKIAKSSAGKTVFTNFNEIVISKKNIKCSKYFILPFIIFLILFFPIYNFSAQSIQKVAVLKKSKANNSWLGSSYPTKAKLNSDLQLDTDKDGVVDILDFDDDNDGILDHYEGFYNINSLRGESIVITVNGSWVLVYTSIYVELPSDLKHGDEFWIPFLGKQYVKAVRIRFENTIDGVRFIQTAAKHTIGDDPELDEDLNYDFDNGGIDSPIALSDNDEGYGIASISYRDKIIISEYLGTTGKVVIGPELDTDNDGLIDSKDTDSDNDGCPDATEAKYNVITNNSLNNGSNGGSTDNLGVISNNNGIPLPFGTIGGNEEIGQENSKESITSEILTTSSLVDVTAKSGEDIEISANATAIKTATFNIGVPNYTPLYGTDTSDYIHYEWYKESDLNTILSTSQTLVIQNANSSDEGTYVVQIKGAGNGCLIQESMILTIEPLESDVLNVSDNFNQFQNDFKIFPNPTNGNINITLSSKESTNVTIILFDAIGKEIFSKRHNIIAGLNDIELNINTVSGIAFLKVISKEVNFGTTKLLFN